MRDIYHEGEKENSYWISPSFFIFLKLVTPCGPGQRVPRPDHLAPKPFPKLAQGSLADLVFSLETYNDILSCLYTSKEIHVNPQDPVVSA